MKKLFGVLVILILVSFLGGCGTTKKVVEAQIVHDSVVHYRDRVVYKFVKDSVSERQKTSTYVKHDTLHNTDTVYVHSEKVVERWRNRVDTVYKTEYLRAKSDSTIVRQPAVKKKVKMSTAEKAWLIFAALFVVWLIGFIYIRSRK